MLFINQIGCLQSFRSKTAVALTAVFGLLFAFGVINIRAQAFSENFDVVPAPGWTTQNNSSPVGSTGWFQGNTARFPAHSGAPNSYIAADFNNTTGNNTISNWLISPQRTFSNGDVIKFWTRQPLASTFADRLQVRLSLAGASTNVGTSATDVGDFATLLLDINPNYNASGYPGQWREYAIILSGIATPTDGRIAFRYFVVNGGPSGPRSDYIGIDTFSYTPASDIVPSQNVVDFDGDGKTDFALVRNTGGGAGGQITWFINLNGTTTTYGSAWGISTDYFLPADYDGDGKSDIAVWRGGAPTVAAFYILQSQSNTLRIEPFGQSSDDPTVVDDYDGDGKADPAVYRSGTSTGQQSTWFYRGSLNNPAGNVTYVPWGQNGDFPSPGDYDGDGRADFVIQRNDGGSSARFWMLQTTAGFASVRFGYPTDRVVPGDYDGDGKTDICVVRSVAGNFHWFVLPSSTGVYSGASTIFGNSATDFPVQGDYDGDGKTDPAVWRSSTTPVGPAFYVRGSIFGIFAVPFGSVGDYPPANFNTH